MKTIYKYNFEITDSFSIKMPEGSEIIYVEEQSKRPAMWALVDTSRQDKAMYFELRGTGQPFNGLEGEYIDTFYMFNGDLVFHLFYHKSLIRS